MNREYLIIHNLYKQNALLLIDNNKVKMNARSLNLKRIKTKDKLLERKNNLKRFLAFLLLVTLFILPLSECVLPACSTAQFPLIFGSTQSDSNIESFDYNTNNGGQLVVAGWTKDDNLRPSYTTSQSPMVVLYRGSPLTPAWGRFAKSDGFQYKGVIFSPDGLYIMAYAYQSTQNARIFICKSSDCQSWTYVRHHYTQESYSRKYKSILSSSRGSITFDHVRIFIAARLWDGANYLGMSLTAIDFLDNGVINPSYSLNPAFLKRSVDATQNDEPKVLLFGHTENEIFMTSYLGGKLVISMLSAITGDVTWSYSFTPNSDTMCVSNYREVGTDHLHYTITGNDGVSKKIARLLIGPISRIPINLSGDVFYESSTTTLAMEPIAVQAINSEALHALLYDPLLMIVYYTYYDLKNMYLSNRKIFPMMPNPVATDTVSMSYFFQDGSFLVGANGQDFFRDPYKNNKQTLSKECGFIFSSVEEQSCYRMHAESHTFGTVVVSTGEVKSIYWGGIGGPIGVNPLQSNTYHLLGTAEDTDPIATGAIVDKSSFCTQNPYAIDRTIYQNPYSNNYYSGLQSYVSVTQYSVTQQCTPGATPTFTYSAVQLGTATLPTYFTTDFANNQIIVTTLAIVGSTTLYIQGLLPNGQGYQSYMELIGVAVPAPTFSSTPLPPVSVPLNSVQKYTFSAINTIAGTTATFTINALQQDNATPTPSVILGSLDVANNCLNLSPVAFADIGDHPVNLVLSNGFASTTYPVTITFTNTQPTFDTSTTGDIPTSSTISLPINKAAWYKMKTIFDSEGHSVGAANGDVQVLLTSKTSTTLQVTIDFVNQMAIQVFSNSYNDVGKTRTVTITLKDAEPLQGNQYQFKVKITNQPPVFTSSPSYNLTVKLNQILNYTLPTYYDPENMPLVISLGTLDSVLKSSIIISSDQTYFTIQPVDFSLFGTHNIDIIVSDGQPLSSKYSLTLYILNTPPYFNQTKPVNQMIRFNNPSFYKLPSATDDEGHQISLVTTSPQAGGFITQDGLGYTFNPKDPIKELGIFTIVGYITDNVTSTSKTEFSFTVTVFNDPPYFTKSLDIVKVTQGEQILYDLPSYTDKEGMTVKTTLKYQDSKVLPDFINATANSMSLNISPTNLTKIGLYLLSVELSDGYAPPSIYQLKVLVSAVPKKPVIPTFKNFTVSNSSFEVQRVKVQMKVLQVSKDGIMTILLNGRVGVSAVVEEVKNQSFRVQMMNGDKKDVPFKIIGKDPNQGIIRVQLQFDDPSKISVGKNMDYIIVSTNEATMVQTQKFISILDANQRYTQYVPSQVSSSQAQIGQSLSKSMKAFQSAFLPGMLAMNIALSIFIQYLWGLLNDLSFLTILTLISINVPGLAKTIQSMLMNFIYLDLLQTNLWFTGFFYQDQKQKNLNGRLLQQESSLVDSSTIQIYSDPLNSFFDDNGFNSVSLVSNLGSTFIYILLYFLGFMILGILRCCRISSPKLIKIKEWLESYLMWNATLRFLLQQFPPILISALINIYYLRFDKISNAICSILSLVLILFLHLAIALMFFAIRKTRFNNNTQEFRDRYGTLTEGMNTRNIVGMYWNVIVLLRWSITIIILVVIRELPEWQIMLLLIVSVLFQCISIVNNPQQDPLDNRISLFNESMISLYLYVLLSLTDFNSENQQRALCGWILLSIVILSTFVGFAKFFFQIGRASCALWKKKKNEKRKKQYEELLQQRENFKIDCKTLEMQENNPYAYSLERPHTTLIETKARGQSVISTLNLLGSVPYNGPGTEKRQQEVMSPEELENRQKEEFKRLFGDTQASNKGLIMIQTQHQNNAVENEQSNRTTDSKLNDSYEQQHIYHKKLTEIIMNQEKSHSVPIQENEVQNDSDEGEDYYEDNDDRQFEDMQHLQEEDEQYENEEEDYSSEQQEQDDEEERIEGIDNIKMCLQTLKYTQENEQEENHEYI